MKITYMQVRSRSQEEAGIDLPYTHRVQGGHDKGIFPLPENGIFPH
jgi:hypothetical protein